MTFQQVLIIQKQYIKYFQAVPQNKGIPATSPAEIYDLKKVDSTQTNKKTPMNKLLHEALLETRKISISMPISVCKMGTMTFPVPFENVIKCINCAFYVLFFL